MTSSISGLKPLSMRSISPQFIRFVLAGGANTILSYAVYATLLGVCGYKVAYSVSYVFGIVSSYSLNAWFVFKVPASWRAALRYPVVYIAQYFCGLTVLYLLVEVAGMSRWSAPLIVVVISVPVTFALSRYVIVKWRKPERMSES